MLVSFVALRDRFEFSILANLQLPQMEMESEMPTAAGRAQRQIEAAPWNSIQAKWRR